MYIIPSHQPPADDGDADVLCDLQQVMQDQVDVEAAVVYSAIEKQMSYSLQTCHKWTTQLAYTAGQQMPSCPIV